MVQLCTLGDLLSQDARQTNVVYKYRTEQPRRIGERNRLLNTTHSNTVCSMSVTSQNDDQGAKVKFVHKYVDIYTSLLLTCTIKYVNIDLLIARIVFQTSPNKPKQAQKSRSQMNSLMSQQSDKPTFE